MQTYGDVITKFSYPWCSTINGLILEIRESTVDYLWLSEGGGKEDVAKVVQGSKPAALQHLAFLAPFPLPGFPALRAFAIAKY